MKAEKNRTAIVLLGIALAFCLSMSTMFINDQGTSNQPQSELLSKYKSTIPLITAPLQILAKGLNIVTD